MKLNKNKGITLVALIITIIILLILAGISISALTQTGIFGKAKQAEQESKYAQEKENTTLGTYENEINEYLEENSETKPSKPTEVKLVTENIGKILSTTENTELEDINGNKIVIPAGFKIISDSTTENATTVDKGIVIEDATEKATKGSQFVWIPVSKDDNDKITKVDGTQVVIKLNRYTFEDDDIGSSTVQDNNAIEKIGNNNVKYYFQELTSSDKGNTVAKSIANFKTSVKINGGYYIGRYEARTTTARSNQDDELTQITEKGTEQVYNFVTQIQAASQAQNMYDNTHPFTSDLMNSYAWDTATLFLQSCGTNSKYSRQKSLNTDSLAITGTTNDIQCNIYDMASNVVEWTTETSDLPSYPCVHRGGRYSNYDNYTSYRGYGYTSSSYAHVGFRPLLYL